MSKGEIFKRYLEEVWEKGNLAALGEFFTDGFVSHSGRSDDDIAAVRTDIELFRAHHPNPHLEAAEQLEAGDRLVTRLRVHSAGKVGFGIVISRFEGERIAETWAVWSDFE